MEEERDGDFLFGDGFRKYKEAREVMTNAGSRQGPEFLKTTMASDYLYHISCGAGNGEPSIWRTFVWERL